MIWSGKITGTTVSQLAKSANHRSDTEICATTDVPLVRGIVIAVASSLIPLPFRRQDG